MGSMRCNVPSYWLQVIKGSSSTTVASVLMRRIAVAPSDLCLQVHALYADTISLACFVYISGSPHCIWCMLPQTMYILVSIKSDFSCYLEHFNEYSCVALQLYNLWMDFSLICTLVFLGVDRQNNQKWFFKRVFRIDWHNKHFRHYLWCTLLID